ncbi:MAG: ABC transporter permease [Chloroflexota bacterium]
MRRDLRVTLSLTRASMKMYFRNRQALFFALFLPLLIMLVFGLIDFESFSEPEIGVADRAQNEASGAVIDDLRAKSESFANVTVGGEEAMRRRLMGGDLDALVVLPEGMSSADGPSVVEVTRNAQADPQTVLVVTLLEDVLRSYFEEARALPQEYQLDSMFRLEARTVSAGASGYAAFLVPGVVAMAIMQLGLFSVVFALVQFRQQGVLRRLQAAPLNPAHFLFAQVSTRLTMSVLQTFVLLLVGMALFEVSIAGAMSWLLLGLLALIGGALFVTIGLAISGFARTEEVAAPVTNLIALPMMFLGDVFFPLESLPEFISSVTQFLPLTFLADAMRAVVTQGAGIADISKELVGLALWSGAAFLAATRLFRWE